MEFVITLGLGGWAILIVGSLVFGGIAQLVGETRTGYEWLVDAIAAGIGALVASEFIVAWQAFGPVVDGLALVPALVGGLVAGSRLRSRRDTSRAATTPTGRCPPEACLGRYEADARARRPDSVGGPCRCR